MVDIDTWNPIIETWVALPGKGKFWLRCLAGIASNRVEKIN